MTQAPVQPAPSDEAHKEPAAPTPTDETAERSTARRRFSTLVLSHFNVDLYPIFIVSLAVSLQENLALTNAQRAMVIAIGPIVSGICQPLFAWIGDVLNTRLFGPAGLAIGAVAISSIGFAQNLTQLLTLQIIGLIGVGVYHPIASAVAGKLGKQALTGTRFVHSPRTTGLSIFFLAGMLGGTFGPLIASNLNDRTGDMRWLGVMMIPGLIMAWFLWTSTRRVEHKSRPLSTDAVVTIEDLGKRRFAVGMLFASNSLRFIANVGCYFLFTAWAKEHFADADIASRKASLLVAATTLGMALATILVSFSRAGNERKMLLLTGIVSAPLLVAVPFLPLPGMMAAAFCASSLYFMGIPAAISLSHRLMPHATGMTGSLLMGVGWVMSASGPIIGERILTLGEHGMALAFGFMALMLVLSGIAGWMLDRDLLRETLDE